MAMTHAREVFCRLLYTVIMVVASVSPTIAIAQSMTLTQAITNTLEHNPQLHQFEIKKNHILGQRKMSSLSPGLNLDFEVENIGGSGRYSDVGSAETTLSLSSVIELGDKRNARTAVRDSELDLVEYQKRAYTLDALGQLNAVFIKTLEIQQLITLAGEARDLAKKTLMIVKRRSGKGAAPDSDIKRSNALLAKSQLILDALTQQHERSLVRLASFWGGETPPATEVEGELYDFGSTPEYSDLYQRALASPAIAVLASEDRLKAAEIQLAQTQGKPDLDWSVGIRRFEDSGESALVAGVSIPLFSGKRSNGDLKSALADRDEVALRRKDALNQLNTRLFDAYSLRIQQVNEVKVYRNTVIPELTSALKATQRAYETGRYSYQDWIAAQKELIEAKQSLIESAAAALLNQTVIEQLVAKPFAQ
ncbi:TolC family protein [Ketobacter sp.]